MNINSLSISRYFYFILLGLLFQSHTALGQTTELQILNEVIKDLQGQHEFIKVESLTFNSIEEACDTDYVQCNSENQVVELDFSFESLCGIIPASLGNLSALEKVDLSYNFLTEDSLGNNPNVTVLTDGNLIGENELQLNFERNLAAHIAREKMDYDSTTFIQEEVYKVIKVMPRFPGCEHVDGDNQEINNCARGEMLEYIYKNLPYPLEDLEQENEGMTVVQFIVGKTGAIILAKNKRNIGKKCGKAALWIVYRMNYLENRWKPGMTKGKSVKTLYTLPIRFKIESYLDEKEDDIENEPKMKKSKKKKGKGFDDNTERSTNKRRF